jgi:hypothetical protein
MLTLALHAVPVDTRAAHHYIVDDRKTALAPDPVTLPVLQSTVGQDSCFVKPHPSVVLRPGEVQLFRVEELPY